MPARSQPKTTTAVTSAQLDALASELESLAGRVRLAARVADGQEQQILAVFNWASVPTGLRLLRSFVAKADESRSAAELGQPLDVGQLKPRSTALRNNSAAERAAIQKEADELAADIEKRMNKHTKSAKPASKPKGKRKAE